MSTTESTSQRGGAKPPCVTVMTLLRTLGLPHRSANTSSSTSSVAVPSAVSSRSNAYVRLLSLRGRKLAIYASERTEATTRALPCTVMSVAPKCFTSSDSVTEHAVVPSCTSALSHWRKACGGVLSRRQHRGTRPP